MSSLISDDLDFTQASGDISTAVSNLIELAVATFDADRDSSRVYLMRAVALLQANCRAHTAVESARGGLATWQLIRVVDYIETRLAGRIMGRHLAGLVNLSQSQLFRAFKASVGMSPHRYITLRRIAFACTMMKTTREPLSMVALASGMSDQSHLCRMFRRITGVSPSAWRRAYGNGPELPSTKPGLPPGVARVTSAAATDNA